MHSNLISRFGLCDYYITISHFTPRIRIILKMSKEEIDTININNKLLASYPHSCLCSFLLNFKDFKDYYKHFLSDATSRFIHNIDYIIFNTVKFLNSVQYT